MFTRPTTSDADLIGLFARYGSVVAFKFFE